MTRFSLSDWANVAEIGAATGVIVTLIFVGFELQSGTEATEAATREAINRKDLAFLSLGIDSTVLAVANTKRRNGEELSALEIDQLVKEQYINFASFDYSYTEFRRGAQDLDGWLRHRNIVQSVIERSPYAKIMWERRQHTFTPEFQELVNSFLSD
jgi:hypothetical protein